MTLLIQDMESDAQVSATERAKYHQLLVNHARVQSVTTADEPFNPLMGPRNGETIAQLRLLAQQAFNAKLPQNVRCPVLFM